MVFVVKQDINVNDFQIFIRDLSENLNSNVKHIVEDTLNDINVNKEVKKRKQNKKKKGLTKEMIIENNIRKKKELAIKEDLHKIKYFTSNIDFNNPYKDICKLKTEEGIIKFKFNILQKLWNRKNKDMENILGLYYQLNKTKSDDVICQDIIGSIRSKLDKYDIKLYMLKNLGHMLPPLNIWDKKELRLEDWQIETLKYMKNNKNVIVSAPTSSGKSFIGISSVIFFKTILYVCPVEPVVYQVGSHFTKMGYKVHYVLENFENISYNDKVNVFVGTPNSIENFLYKHGNNFDYAVFDEIHNLNKKDDGNIYENLIKLIDCNFLALSATIKDINKLKDIFENIKKDKINTVIYNKRFINQQRWVWYNDKLIELHPLACFEDDNINNILNYNLPFSPKDVALLWEEIEKEFDKYTDETEDDDLYSDILDLSPDNYFSNTEEILTLDMSKEYEDMLKNKLIELNNKYPDNIQNIIKQFKCEYQESISNTLNIVPMLLDAKNKDMLPMLIFNTEKNNCINLLKQIYEDLQREELYNYPFHYDILEKKNKLYEEYETRFEEFKSKIKISKNVTDPSTYIEEKSNSFTENEKNKYIYEMQEYYTQLLEKVQDNDLQYNNLMKEYNSFMENPDFCWQNVFKKHEKYCFTNKEPMTDSSIRNIRKKIYNSTNIKLDYTHPLLQLLKRGIGIYIDGMPNEYNWIVQQLLANKEIGIVICDRMLCLGIDLPIRTSCIAGIGDNNNFTQDDYIQMSGRAGRRGFDVKGNIIFWNIDFKRLMKSELIDIKGSEKSIYNSYKTLNKKIKNIECIFNNFINKDRQLIEVDNINNKDNEKWIDILQWKFRKYKNGNKLLNSLINIEKDLFMITNDYDKQILIIDNISKILYENNNLFIDIYKLNKIKNNSYKTIEILEDFNSVLIDLYNNIHKHKYMTMKPQILHIINNFKIIINNYSGINYL
jgi:late competence protein required for DNA uptake (superfamily II DNA/RNA helicase)